MAGNIHFCHVYTSMTTDADIAAQEQEAVNAALRSRDGGGNAEVDALRAELLSLRADMAALRDDMPDDPDEFVYIPRVVLPSGGGAVDSEKTAGDDLQSRSIEKDATTREMRLFEMLVPTGTDTTLATNELVGIRQAEDADGVPRMRWIVPLEVLRWLVTGRTQVKRKASTTATEYTTGAVQLAAGAVWTIDDFAWDVADAKLTIYVGQECMDTGLST